jgi:hypothetical protein
MSHTAAAGGPQAMVRVPAAAFRVTLRSVSPLVAGPFVTSPVEAKVAPWFGQLKPPETMFTVVPAWGQTMLKAR